MLITRRLAGVSTLLVALMLALSAYLGHSSAQRPPALHVMKSSWIADFSVDENIARHYDNIYIGTIVSYATANDFYPKVDGEDENPASKYTVKVQQTIKGKFSGNVVLFQFGGYTSDGKELVLAEGDWLLQPDRKYLFASSSSGPDGEEILLNTYGHDDLSSLEPREVEAKVTAMKEAVARVG